MRNALIVSLALIFVFAGAGLVFAQSQQTQPPERGQGWFCPWCGGPEGYGGGPHMRGGRGMGPGYDMHHGWSRGQCPRTQYDRMQPMGRQNARQLMENYVAANPNLKIGEITEKDEAYIGEVVTKDGSLVEKLVVDKRTGWMKRTY